MRFKVITTGVFVIVLVIRTFCPDVIVDNTSIILLLLAFSPWIIQYIKSFEINGVGKVELVDRAEKKKIEQTANDAGIIGEKSDEIMGSEYTFYNHRYDDAKLALAGLRMEIESCLRKISERNSLNINYGGIRQMTDILSKHQLIDNNESSLIRDMTGILNKAVHSQLDEYDNDSFDWVFDMGLKLLASLEKKAK